MLVAGQKDMQQLDQYTMERIGLPGVVLMENAGAKVVEEIMNSLPLEQAKIVVLAGGGNNGGDGFVIARLLADKGINTLLCVLVDVKHVKGDAKVHLDVYKNRHLPLFELSKNTLENLKKELNIADIIIDAMLGTGVNGAVREPFSEVISIVNDYGKEKLVMSVDIPSGVSSDTGKVEGVAIIATKTVSFVLPKKGFFLAEGPRHIGEWKVVDISVPLLAIQELGLTLPALITKSLVKSSLPVRPPHGHKGTFGHVLIVGGSRPYVGAPVYAAKSAFFSGAGLVTLAIPENIYPMVATQNPESLLLPLAEQDGHFAEHALEELSSRLSTFTSIAIGPGMGRFDGGERLIKNLFTSLANQSIVLDADALFFIRNQLDLIRHYNGDVILTPHPGEMATLLNTTVQEIEANRLDVAKDFAVSNQVYLMLKGHRSIIATPTGEVYINPFGNDALGKGGSGDVLTGLITSFLAQGASPTHALISASYVHAKAGEEQAKIYSQYGVTPLDTIDGIRKELIKLS